MNTQVTQTLTQEPISQEPVGKLSVYYCGGTGLNIEAEHRKALANFSRTGMAELLTYKIDTSRSNLAAGAHDNLYRFKGLDGLGKKRDEDPLGIKKKVPEILAAFEPQETSLIVGGISGGSGSLLLPLMAAELTRQGKNVIVLGVISTDTDTEIENAIDTMGNMEKTAASTGRPVIFKPYVNPANGDQASVDKQIVLDIMMLAMLYSRRNVRMDNADLNNWLNYNRNKSNTAPVKLVSMKIFSEADMGQAKSLQADDITPITAATLAPINTSTRAPWPLCYQATGFVPAKATNELTGPVHFTVVDGEIAKIDESLHAELNKLQAQKSATTYAKTLGGGQLNDLF